MIASVSFRNRNKTSRTRSAVRLQKLYCKFRFLLLLLCLYICWHWPTGCLVSVPCLPTFRTESKRAILTYSQLVLSISQRRSSTKIPRTVYHILHCFKGLFPFHFEVPSN